VTCRKSEATAHTRQPRNELGAIDDDSAERRRSGRNTPDSWWSDHTTRGSPSGSAHNDGTTVYQWPVDSPQDKHLHEAMERQAERFHEKFGRDPGPEDPIFFDPDADEPRPFDLDIATREMAEELRHAGIAAGIDPSLIEAWCELGYVVTEDTRHLFSASDIAVWNETVRRHAGDLEEDDDLNGDEVSHKDLPDVPGPQRY
jgi:hypothetical protein